MKKDSEKSKSAANASDKADSPAMSGSALSDAIALIKIGPGQTVEWLKVAGPMCAHCIGRENVDQAAGRIVLAELTKLRGIIARNAMQRLKGEDAIEMYITADDIKDSLEVLYAWQREAQNADLGGAK